MVTKNAHYIHADFFWQERFRDHIIRDSESFEKIQIYIANNVANCNEDKFYNNIRSKKKFNPTNSYSRDYSQSVRRESQV